MATRCPAKASERMVKGNLRGCYHHPAGSLSARQATAPAEETVVPEKRNAPAEKKLL